MQHNVGCCFFLNCFHRFLSFRDKISAHFSVIHAFVIYWFEYFFLLEIFPQAFRFVLKIFAWENNEKSITYVYCDAEVKKTTSTNLNFCNLISKFSWVSMELQWIWFWALLFCQYFEHPRSIKWKPAKSQIYKQWVCLEFH